MNLFIQSTVASSCRMKNKTALIKDVAKSTVVMLVLFYSLSVNAESCLVKRLVPSESDVTVTADLDIACLQKRIEELEQYNKMLIDMIGNPPNWHKILPSTVEVPISVNISAKNPLDRPIFIAGRCNATNDSKQIDGFISESPDFNNSGRLVASETGIDKLSIAFIVPPKWFYKVKNTTVANLSCEYVGWSL